MNKKFGGFSQPQLEAVARKMGYSGSMEGFNKWVASSPERATKLSKLHDTARKFVEGGAQNYSTGGRVISRRVVGRIPVDNLPGTPAPTPAPTPRNTPAPAQSPGTVATNTAINNPNALVTNATATPTATNPSQIINPNSGRAPTNAETASAAAPTAAQTNASTAQTQTVQNTATAANPQTQDANTYDPTLVGGQVNNVVNNTQAVRGAVSGRAQAQAATALPSANATVQGQLEGLMAQFEGGETPPWAAGAMRMANTAMAQRGLGASSMAGAAVTQAAMESAISIAAQDAATFSQFEMQNLNNRQQARLQNAQAFLQMDLANLDVANQTNLFRAQARIQGLFTDQAASNAADQFNATSQNQTDQFFSSLRTQVQQFNAAQRNAMAQFNTGQVNSGAQFNAAQRNTVGMFNTGQTNQMRQVNAQQAAALSMFNAEQQNARDQFNAENRLIIDQSNAQWRRQIATQDNAQINETNRLNAQLSTGLTTAAYNNLFQQERDLMAFAFTAAENANQRSHEIVLQRMSGDSYRDAQRAQGQAALGAAAGSLISNIIDGLW